MDGVGRKFQNIIDQQVIGGIWRLYDSNESQPVDLLGDIQRSLQALKSKKTYSLLLRPEAWESLIGIVERSDFIAFWDDEGHTWIAYEDTLTAIQIEVFEDKFIDTPEVYYLIDTTDLSNKAILSPTPEITRYSLRDLRFS